MTIEQKASIQDAAHAALKAIENLQADEHHHWVTINNALDTVHNQIVNLEALALSLVSHEEARVYRRYLSALTDHHAVMTSIQSDTLEDRMALNLTRSDWEAMGRPGSVHVTVEPTR